MFDIIKKRYNNKWQGMVVVFEIRSEISFTSFIIKNKWRLFDIGGHIIIEESSNDVNCCAHYEEHFICAKIIGE